MLSLNVTERLIHIMNIYRIAAIIILLAISRYMLLIDSVTKYVTTIVNIAAAAKNDISFKAIKNEILISFHTK